MIASIILILALFNQTYASEIRIRPGMIRNPENPVFIPFRPTRSYEPGFGQIEKMFKSWLCIMALRSGANVGNCKLQNNPENSEDVEKFIQPRLRTFHVMF